MLRNKRRRKGLSQSKLAKNLKIDKSHVSRLERKVKNYSPSIDLIKKLAKELECCPVELFVFFAEIDCKYFNNRKDNELE